MGSSPIRIALFNSGLFISMKWTEKEINKAINLLKEGASTEEVAKQLDRTQVAIRNKLNSKGIKLSKVKSYYESRKCRNCGATFKCRKKGNDRFCSQSCSATYNNLKRSPEVYEKQSRTLKRKGHKPPSGTGRNKEGSNIKCPICGTVFYVAKSSTKTFCSRKCVQYDRRNGNKFCKSVGGYRKNSTNKLSCTYKGFQMDSGSEKKFAMLLDEEGIKWQKNSTVSFPYKDKKTGKRRKYIPDFYLPEYDFWVEIKGKYYQTYNLSEKLKAVGSNIELMYHNEIRLPRCISRSTS